MSTHSVLNQETELIQKRPLKEDIFDVLHEKIISGLYKPGDWLRQDDIATQLGVSMTPVREALDLLVSSGLAERVPYRGVRVREISAKDVGEAYGLRLVLEAIIAREAARNITRGQVSGLERTIVEMKKHDSLKEMSTARLKVIRETTDGFRIAEEDLKLRGEGDVLGIRQSGLPGYRIARSDVHAQLITQARDEALRIMKDNPKLKGERGEALRCLLYLYERDEAVPLIGAG